MKVRTIGALLLAGASLSATPAGRALPGDLPEPLAQMTSGELFAFGAGLRFDNGPVQDRDCERGRCLGRIDAVRDQTPGPAAISANGTIVARLVNLGGNGGNEGPENRYGTARGQSEFYIVALKSDSGWRWTVREAVRNANTPPRETISGTWTTCRHDPSNPDHPKGRSQFASCSDTTGAAPSGARTRPSGPQVREGTAWLLPPNPHDPGWLSCSDGCCTAGQ